MTEEEIFHKTVFEAAVMRFAEVKGLYESIPNKTDSVNNIAALLYLANEKIDQGDFTVANTLLENITPIIQSYLEHAQEKKILTDRVDHLERLSVIDDKTGISNLQAAHNYLSSAMKLFSRQLTDHYKNEKESLLNSEFKKSGQPVHLTPPIVLFVDIVDFKSVNDKYGHDAGDKMLNAIAKTISQKKRASAIGARFGGDEFLIILKNLTPHKIVEGTKKTQLEVVKERFAKEISNTEIEHNGRKISRGARIGHYIVEPEDIALEPDEIIARADPKGYGERTVKAVFDTVLKYGKSLFEKVPRI